MARMRALAVLALLPLSGCTHASSAHITVTREMLLEVGNGAIEPTAIIRTSDGGYVIAGHDVKKPWATRIDGQGKVIWRHEYDVPSGMGWSSRYNGAVLLKDGAVLLCGNVQLNQESPTPAPAQIVGLFTRLDGRGNVISNHQLIFFEHQAVHLNYIDRCIPVEGGIIAVGYTAKERVGSSPNGNGIAPDSTFEGFRWVIGLDQKGTIQWQKVIPGPAIHDEIYPLIALPQGGFVLMAESTYGVIRFSANGDVEATTQTEGGQVPVTRMSDRRSAPFELQSVPKRGPVTFTTRSERLEPIRTRELPRSEGLTRFNVFELPDGALAVFGSREGTNGSYTAAVGWISDNGTNADSFVFQPISRSAWIKAAVPTGTLGEFATVRTMIPVSEPDVVRAGVMLTFIRFQ